MCRSFIPVLFLTAGLAAGCAKAVTLNVDPSALTAVQAAPNASDPVSAFKEEVLPLLRDDIAISVGQPEPYRRSEVSYKYDPSRTDLQYFVLPISFSYADTVLDNLDRQLEALSDASVTGKGKLPRRYAHSSSGYQKFVFLRCAGDNCAKTVNLSSHAVKDDKHNISAALRFPPVRIRLLDAEGGVLLEETLSGQDRDGKQIFVPCTEGGKHALRPVIGTPLAYGEAGSDDFLYIYPERTVRFLVGLDAARLKDLAAVNVTHVRAAIPVPGRSEHAKTETSSIPRPTEGVKALPMPGAVHP